MSSDETTAKLVDKIINSKLSEENSKAVKSVSPDIDNDELTVNALTIAGQIKSAIDGNTKAFIELNKLSKKKQNKMGKPKKFENGEELISLFRDFCNSIKESGYTQIPNQSNFCRWLENNYEPINRRTIYNSLNRYFPSIKKEFEQLQGDLIAEGAMLNKWNSTMSIFALKNWCKWTDKPQTDTDTEMLNKLDAVLDKINGD